MGVIERIERRLDVVVEMLEVVIRKENQQLRKEALMSAQLDALTLQVEKNTDAEQSAIVLIEGIAAALIAARDDPAKIDALASNLKVSAEALAAAVVANTQP